MLRGDGASMVSFERFRGRTLLRVLVLAAGLALIAFSAYRLGFTRTEVIVITAVGGVLSALAIELPWKGFLFPGDALLVCLCLLTASNRIVLLALGLALVSAGLAVSFLRTAVVAALRNGLACLVAVAIWRLLVPSLDILLEGGRSFHLTANTFGNWLATAEAIPALLLASLAFVVGATVMESLLRGRREYAFGEFWLLNAGRNFHHLIFTAVLGSIAAVAYRDAGAVAFVFFAFPVILTRDALKRSLELRTSRFQALKALSSSVDARDRYTYDHSSRVSRLASLLAREMGFPESTVELIEGGALLHDIGKLSVDIDILSKPGSLDDGERAAIQRHPLTSAEVVSRVDLLKESTDIVRHHHERPDGRGYPGGLKGHEIPVGARILNVADAFDAMISDRPYRNRRSVEEALDELRRGAGDEFDPVVVEYLTRMIENRRDEILGSGDS
jgi:putative nucleotidyltransferase with HDIG domain